MLRSFMPTQLHLAYYWLGFSLGSFAVASLDLLGVVTRSSLDISSLVALIFGAGVPCHCRGQQQARLLRLASDCNCFSRWLWNSDVSMHAGNPDRPHPNLALRLSPSLLNPELLPTSSKFPCQRAQGLYHLPRVPGALSCPGCGSQVDVLRGQPQFHVALRV